MERIVMKVSMLTVFPEIAELGSESLEDPLDEATRNSDKVGLALWTQ
jgi:hypothetical protein